MSMSPHTPPSAKKQGWFARHWMWVIPIIGCVGMVVLIVAFAGVIVTAIFGAMRMSSPYQDAMARAQEHPEVVAALGEPIVVGWMISGNINVNGPSGEANLAIPISGPRGSATLYVEGEKRAGEWHYDVMEVAIEESGERISLLAAEIAACPVCRTSDTVESQPLRVLGPLVPC